MVHARYNSLPARPEYVEKVKKCLIKKNGRTEQSIAKATGLTKTQALCAIDAMVAKNEILVEGKPKKFFLVEE
ncbi:hypothetical protein GPM19_10365 [Halomonas sp. ZH2S]|uniref:MarR family transcriptional regulator n=1 Tax=Vreelandella zhuhanensis TaxID=2684210 RepID=A0A7X3KQK8_9GAMM|nr:hypothetical protein [Halomonas zhuhanensis]MWJ28604.1 hypothetical protein [Halomonas zhuhanensis]